ncbi:MAG: hypothetical protein Q7U37_04740 [Gallionella sp.]|nr:hypothetical protein [Gallionella sp.]MDP1941046.1 hypothetical protein [Gallionella sp.]
MDTFATALQVSLLKAILRKDDFISASLKRAAVVDVIKVSGNIARVKALLLKSQLHDK